MMLSSELKAGPKWGGGRFRRSYKADISAGGE